MGFDYCKFYSTQLCKWQLENQTSIQMVKVWLAYADDIPILGHSPVRVVDVLLPYEQWNNQQSSLAKKLRKTKYVMEIGSQIQVNNNMSEKDYRNKCTNYRGIVVTYTVSRIMGKIVR